MKVMIVYHTKTGHTLEAVHALAEGIRSAGSEADLVTAKQFTAGRIADYDALIAGSPCWFGSVVGGIAKPLQVALEGLDAGALQGKKAAAISVGSFGGAKGTVAAMGAILQQKGCAEFVPGPTAFAGVPLSVVKGPSVSAKDEDRFRAFGAQFVA
jgi:flavorubredoxin